MFSQLYMAQILKVQTRPNHLCDSHYIQYNLKCNIQSEERHAVSMCSAVIVGECLDIYIYDYMCVYLHTRVCVCVCQVALRTMCGCIARVCFVLFRLKVVAERRCLGKVWMQEGVCMFTMAATFSCFIVIS